MKIIDAYLSGLKLMLFYVFQRAGVFILCAALCDKFKKVDSKQSYDEMDNWINVSKFIC